MKRFVWCAREVVTPCRIESDHAHICISDPNQEKARTSCPEKTAYLSFYDLSKPIEGYADHLFNEDHAKTIVEFVRSLPDDAFVVVNCEAGISRSPGVVLAMRRFYGGNTEEIFQRAIPNILVSSLLTRELTKSR